VADQTRARHPHAVLDLDSRTWKAKKIEWLLRLAERAAPMRMLEVGTGSGGIAAHFARSPERYQVDAVDVADLRQVVQGFHFQVVADTRLPFADETFDVVISNHVLEHVGDTTEQTRHLGELRRVLRDDGVGYLAVPNRWMLVEPHYRLMFLSWWPAAWRHAWLKLWGRGDHYDCLPLSRRELEALLRSVHLHFAQVHREGLLATLAIEPPRSIWWRLPARLPRWLHEALRGWYPTLIYRLWR
jgi:SAM-dependent methyltransferase